MDKTWIEVADNVVKIGLPSLITGFVTILGMRYSAKSSQDKYVLEHKIKLLEKISDDIDTYFNALNMFLSRAKSIAIKADNDLEHIELNQKNIDGIKERDVGLVESWVKLYSSVSKLRLLKAEKAVEKLRVCTKIEYSLREEIIFQKKIQGFNNLSKISDQVKEAQSEFHKELAEFYEKITS
ncbi:hypothetical protein [Cellvibrio sp. OA-2007]|uniref:hypothetical protein n=1 Tax=Cellvibrio sp. OA-2007 TaxID=529823 RepID=UPI000780C110|nr:hypothetical protein [Cellvibrio sp. OA-2007]